MQLNVVMSVSMPLQLAQRVEKAVKETDTTISALLREAVERHLAENPSNPRKGMSHR